MQNLSSNQREHIENVGTLGVTITVDPVEGSQVTIEAEDLQQGTLSVDRAWTNSDSLEIGCSYTSELKFHLDNQDGQWSDVRWEGARLTVTLDINGEPLRLGIFTVDEQPRKLTTMQIRALDDMARFNRPYNSTLPFPATLQQILVDACARCNVTLYTQSFDNDDYVVTQKPEGDDITYHHIVSWVAELAGCNAWIDHLGRLQLSWYGDNQSGDLEIGPEDRFDYELAEEDVEITGIVYRAPAEGDEEEIDYVAGTDDYALVIEDNPLLQENYEAILSALYSKIGGFKYRPYSFSVLGYPHLWPGDVITKLIDADGNELSSIITNHTYALNGNSQLDAKGETETVRGYATGAPFTSSQKRVLQSVAHVEASRQTSALEQATLALNELMANSLGFYSTTIEQETGAKVVYTHDQPALEESMVIWTRTEQGFAWTDQGWNDGNPNWQYGVTGDGSMIIKLITAVGIKAEWIDAIDLSAITSRFTELWAGNVQGAHLHMGEQSGDPFLTMFDDQNKQVYSLNSSGIRMNGRGEIWFPYYGDLDRFATIRSHNEPNRKLLSLRSGGSGLRGGGAIQLFHENDADPTDRGTVRIYGSDGSALRAHRSGLVEFQNVAWFAGGNAIFDYNLDLPQSVGDAATIRAHRGTGRQVLYLCADGPGNAADNAIRIGGRDDDGWANEMRFYCGGNRVVTFSDDEQFTVHASSADHVFRSDRLSMRAKGMSQYPYIEWIDEDGNRGAFLGWGAKNDRIEFNMNNVDYLRIRNGDIRVEDGHGQFSSYLRSNSYIRADGGFRAGSAVGQTVQLTPLRNLSGGYYLQQFTGGILTSVTSAG